MEVVITRLTVANTAAMVELFERISKDQAASNFYPHPFSREEAERIAGNTGRDVYLGIFANGVQIGYGMLRGWDAGYDVPSLGIYLTPEGRGRGLARMLMEELHDYARRSGASCVRLKVHPDNVRAVRLYKRLGYCFDGGVECGQHVAFLHLLEDRG
jgi:ribosomal-protein-alanine N-acetyltransferase